MKVYEIEDYIIKGYNTKTREAITDLKICPQEQNIRPLNPRIKYGNDTIKDFLGRDLSENIFFRNQSTALDIYKRAIDIGAIKEVFIDQDTGRFVYLTDVDPRERTLCAIPITLEEKVEDILRGGQRDNYQYYRALKFLWANNLPLTDSIKAKDEGSDLEWEYIKLSYPKLTKNEVLFLDKGMIYHDGRYIKKDKLILEKEEYGYEVRLLEGDI